MKIFNIIFAILFVLFAALQYNDPDPYVWIPIYMYAAILCWIAFRGKYYPKAYLFGIVIYLAYAIYLVFAPDGVIDWIEKHNAEDIAGTMKATKPWIEDTREFLGLVILIVVLLIDYFYSRKRLPRKVI
ncbi:MAG: transmembrane 220 family protein [Chitinophagaceae bacterium]